MGENIGVGTAGATDAGCARKTPIEAQALSLRLDVPRQMCSNGNAVGSAVAV